jgi:guanylate kinase
MATEKKGMMFILSSPSGAGKTTLTKKIAKNNTNFIISISHTTRKPRPNEIDGKDYFFVSKEEFNSLVENNDFFEYAKIFDNYYGTLKKPVQKILSSGKDVLFDIYWQGTQQLKKIDSLSLHTFFILPPNIKVLKERLLNRHLGQTNLIEKRMKKFNEELSHWSEYNYVVVNDDLEVCYKKILSIMNSQKQGAGEKQDIKKIKKKVADLMS